MTIHTTAVEIWQLLYFPLVQQPYTPSPAGKPHAFRHFMYLYLLCSFAVPEVASVSFLNLKSSKALNPVSSPPPTVDMHAAPRDKDPTRRFRLSMLRRNLVRESV